MIFLARHGETPFNAEGRFQGRLPVPLSDRGVEQAHELARVAAQRDWAILWCSPLHRARQTADIVAAAIGLEPVEEARLEETDCGDWTGRSFAEVRAEDPEGFAAYERLDAAWGFPGGESFAQQSARVADGARSDRPRPLAGAGRLPSPGRAPGAGAAHRRPGDARAEIANASLVELP